MDLSENIQLDMTTGNLSEGVQTAVAAEKQGYDIIISRGGTAVMIQESVSIPIVHISITGYDMLRVFALIRGLEEKVALVGFENITDGAATICDILEYDVKTITITSQSEVRDKLKMLKQSGFSVVIGDVITVETARQIGLRGVLIASGKDAVMDAVIEGERVYRFFCKMTEQYRHFQQAFLHMPYPVVLLDKEGCVLEGNNMYHHVLEYHEMMAHPYLIPFIDKVIHSGENQWEVLRTRESKYHIQGFLINSRDPVVGVVIYDDFNKMEQEVIRLIGSPKHKPIIGESGRIALLKENVQHALKTSNNIGIFGERGTGKLSLAEEIHFEELGENSPVIIIDCKALKTDTDIYTQIRRGFTAVNRGTIIVRNFEVLLYDAKNMIGQMMIDLMDDVRVIILETTSEKDSESIELSELADEKIYLEPLRLRKDDIPFLANYFLTDIRMENGSEKVGIKPDAMECLGEYEWPGNLSQLKKVIKELSRMPSENYIELSHVQHVLKRQIHATGGGIETNTVQLIGTLEEIEHTVIQQVMKEEGNNQSITAKRLGINRSTLWRKLNKWQKGT